MHPIGPPTLPRYPSRRRPAPAAPKAYLRDHGATLPPVSIQLRPARVDLKASPRTHRWRFRIGGIAQPAAPQGSLQIRAYALPSPFPAPFPTPASFLPPSPPFPPPRRV